jgi:hypothetical protein
MTHLNNNNKKNERFTVDCEELCQVVMEMRSYMGDPYALPYWPHGLGDNQPPPPPVSPLF